MTIDAPLRQVEREQALDAVADRDLLVQRGHEEDPRPGVVIARRGVRGTARSRCCPRSEQRRVQRHIATITMNAAVRTI